MNITLDVPYLRSRILRKQLSYKNIYEEFLDYFTKVAKKKLEESTQLYNGEKYQNS